MPGGGSVTGMTLLSRGARAPHTQVMAARAERARVLAATGFSTLILLVAGVAVANPGWTPILAPAGALVLVAGVVAHRRLGVRARKWRVGADAEREVSTILGRLDGRWRTWHSVSTGRGDLDHLVVGPTGVFVIETKSHRDLHRVPEGMIVQAQRGARWAGRRLRVRAVPVLCLTRTPVYAPRLVDGVWVVNPGHLVRLV